MTKPVIFSQRARKKAASNETRSNRWRMLKTRVNQREGWFVHSGSTNCLATTFRRALVMDTWPFYGCCAPPDASRYFRPARIPTRAAEYMCVYMCFKVREHVRSTRGGRARSIRATGEEDSEKCTTCSLKSRLEKISHVTRADARCV